MCTFQPLFLLSGIVRDITKHFFPALSLLKRFLSINKIFAVLDQTKPNKKKDVQFLIASKKSNHKTIWLYAFIRQGGFYNRKGKFRVSWPGMVLFEGFKKFKNSVKYGSCVSCKFLRIWDWALFCTVFFTHYLQLATPEICNPAKKGHLYEY